MEKRITTDRRRQATPIISRYLFRGRRRCIRRKEDQAKEKYVDRCNTRWLFFLALVIGLNCLDSYFTLMILRNGGQELNPLVASSIRLWGNNFWIWKLVVVSFCSFIIYLHSQFEVAKFAVFLLCSIYMGLIFYQLIGLTFYTL
jgi:hypothetical protein